MCKDTIRLIREEGKAVFRNLEREIYLNHAGLKNKTEINEILTSHRELLETEIFQSLKDATPNAEENKNGIKLILSFLADIILLNKSSKLEDHILDIEASAKFSVGKTTIPFRKSRQALLTKSKIQDLEDIEEKRTAILSKLNELYLRKYAYLQKDSHDIGFSSYLDLYEFKENHDSANLLEKAKEFLRDTEYISRELLTWFFSRRMDTELKDATTNNLFYLLSSFELKDSFPKMNPHWTATAILEQSGIELPAKIMFDTEKRKAHISGSISYISNPGTEMLISTNIQGNIFDYESFLQRFGESLCYGFTHPDDYFEFTDLRENSFLKLFSELFKNFIYEPEWLKKQFRMDAEDDFFKFIYLRRLLILRITCAKVIFEIGLYQRHDDKTEMYREIMHTATHCKPLPIEYLEDIQPHLSSVDSFKAVILEIQMQKYLTENYDEQWWREQEANKFLIKIWQTGGRTPLNNLSEKCGFEDIRNTNLLKSFEEVLG